MNKNFIKILGFLSLFLTACTQKEVKPVVNDEMKRVKSETEAYNSLRKRKEVVRRKVKEIRDNNRKKLEQENILRFDVKTDELPAKLFFMNLMAGSGRNIVVHPDVSGEITLSLNSVTLDEVLSVVRDVYGFDYKYENTIYTIFPRELRTEVFPINYINVNRVGLSDTSVLTGNVESSSQASSQTVSQGTSSTGENDNISPGSRIQTRTETDFWVSLDRALSELIGVSGDNVSGGATSGGKQRKVITNPQTGVAIVTAMPSELASVKTFLDKTRLSVKRQVIIEAKILEVQLNDGNQTGVNWNAINGQLLLGKNASEFEGSVNVTEISEDIGEIFSSLVRISDVSTLLSLLETQGELQVLSSPRVSTVNNQKAVIRVGSDRFFVTGLSSSTVSNASSTTSSPDIELSSFFSGISLDVTPQISDEGSVILHIHPVVSTVTEEQKNIIIGDSAFSLPLALRDIRESDSIVRAQSGQVIVLGGLMQERISNTQGKRPGLSDIPFAGNLFNTQSNSRVKSELIILLKPIVVEQDSWVNDVDSTNARFEQLGQFDKIPALNSSQSLNSQVVDVEKNLPGNDFDRADIITRPLDSFDASPAENLLSPGTQDNQSIEKNVSGNDADNIYRAFESLNKSNNISDETLLPEKLQEGDLVEQEPWVNDTYKEDFSPESSLQAEKISAEVSSTPQRASKSEMVKKYLLADDVGKNESLEQSSSAPTETVLSRKVIHSNVIEKNTSFNEDSKTNVNVEPFAYWDSAPTETVLSTKVIDTGVVESDSLVNEVDKVDASVELPIHPDSNSAEILQPSQGVSDVQTVEEESLNNDSNKNKSDLKSPISLSNATPKKSLLLQIKNSKNIEKELLVSDIYKVDIGLELLGEVEKNDPAKILLLPQIYSGK